MDSSNPNDEAAFDRIVDAHRNMVFTIVLSVVRNREVAEEVAEDVFVKVYFARARFEGRSKLSTWIYRMAYNEAVSAWRRMRHDPVIVDDSQHVLSYVADHPYDSQHEEQLRRLDRVVGQLPSADKLIVTLYYYKALSVAEVARIMRLSRANVRIRLFRIRRRLYDEMLSDRQL